MCGAKRVNDRGTGDRRGRDGRIGRGSGGQRRSGTIVGKVLPENPEARMREIGMRGDKRCDGSGDSGSGGAAALLLLFNGRDDRGEIDTGRVAFVGIHAVPGRILGV